MCFHTCHHSNAMICFISHFPVVELPGLGAGLTSPKTGAQEWTAVKTAPLHKVGSRIRVVPHYWQGI